MHKPSFWKWLYPGMKVKRWLGLAALSAIALGLGLLLLVGKGPIGLFYDLLSDNRVVYYLVGAVFLCAGLLGVVWGLNRSARSVLEGFTGQVAHTSDIIWQKRFLSRGPRIVTIGGGTGLSVLLRGLKQYTSNITAIVTVTDDGGSSGRLRREMGMLPPGDIRNCIIALSDDESLMSKMFQHRFKSGEELQGHSLGNLFIAGMEKLTGGFDRAIEEASRMLNIRGQVVPSTLTNTDLVAQLETGEEVIGESKVSQRRGAVSSIDLVDRAEPHPKAVQALRTADYIVVGPGSLYTSLIPNLLVKDLAREIEKAGAEKFFVVNIMTEPGETDGFSASDHLRALNSYLDVSSLNWAVVNSGQVKEDLLEQYAQEGAEFVAPDLTDDNEFGLRVLSADLIKVIELEGKKTIKHNYNKLAELIVSH